MMNRRYEHRHANFSGSASRSLPGCPALMANTAHDRTLSTVSNRDTGIKLESSTGFVEGIGDLSNYVQQRRSSRVHSFWGEWKFKTLRGLGVVNDRFLFRVAGATLERFLPLG